VTLDWLAPTPPPLENFDEGPVVTRGLRLLDARLETMRTPIAAEPARSAPTRAKPATELHSLQDSSMSHDGHHSVVIPAPGPEFVPHTVAHHFDTPVQEFQSAKLGFWLFLATEILLFGGLFAAYFYYHEMYPETFRLGGQQLDWKLGALNTTVLLLSSWTMAMGVRSAQTSQKQKT
jgi:hypothetical protein